ncbi:MAG: MarR family transcriptional regulator [Anaerolineales bacterium]|jgi:DNA-binding MarR family transcriptional regulator
MSPKLTGSPEGLEAAFREWTDLFMRRSMHGLVRSSKDLGLSVSQIMALFQIYRRGTYDVSDIGGELGVTSAAASQLLEGLVQRDLITRVEDAHDRRIRRILLTEEGRRVLQKIRSRERWTQGLACALTPAEQERVIAALRILIEKASQLEGTPGHSPRP